MRVSLTTKQAMGVTALIALSMTALSALQLASLARVGLQASQANGELLVRAIYQRAREAIAGAADPHAALRDDPGIRSILESTIAYGPNLTYAAIVTPANIVIAHSFPGVQGERLDPQQNLATVLEGGMVEQVRAIYADRTLEITQSLELAEAPFGAIRIGLSPVLIRNDLSRALRPMLLTTVAVLAISTFVGLVLARRVLRPIHVISTGLTRLGRGETGVTIDLPPDEELKDLGQSFNAISRQLADRAQGGTFDSAVDYSRKLASLSRLLAGVAHEVKNPLNAMNIHLELVRQHLATAGDALRPATDAHRSRAGTVLGLTTPQSAIEPRATTATLAHTGDLPVADSEEAAVTRRELDDAREHVEVIAGEIRRLDEVIQAFLRFMRPQELRLEAISISAMIKDVMALVEPEVHRAGIVCKTDYGSSLPDLQADAALIRQALLNLALNACQAMPNGGALTIAARRGKGGRIVLEVEDTGTGIAPEQLEKIFDLYYTTKAGGSGIGLSMVYRIAQLHGGEVEVESTPGRGTRFRVLLPQP
jgi:signal transduction histidine kinase